MLLATLLLLSPLALAPPAEIIARIRSNDLAWLRQQTTDPEFIRVADARGNTPLLWAASHGTPAALDLLLAAGAPPNQANSLGITPLIASATEPAKVKSLLAKGANPKAKSQIGQHALIIAASSPQATQSVQALLAAGAPVNEPGARGTTALLAAADNHCSAASIRLLLAAGADAKAVDPSGSNVLNGAVASCPLDLIADLIARGANVNQQNSFGGDVRKGKIQLVGISPLMLAAAHREAPLVELLLKSGANPNAKDIRGMTPLIYASSSKDQNAATIQFLLAAGADPNARDIYGQTAADWRAKFSARPQYQPTSGPGPQKALELLEHSNETLFQESGCISCHHTSLLSLAASRAPRAGLKPNPDLAAARAARLRGMVSAFSPPNHQLLPLPGAIDTALYLLLEAKTIGIADSADFDHLARYVHAQQMPSGAFTMRGISRFPLEEADIHRTAVALYSLSSFPHIAERSRLDLATRWLAAQPVNNRDEAAMKLLGLAWGRAPQSQIQAAAKSLAKLQLADGSFEDPYFTGLAIFALREAAAWPPSHKVISRAAGWLRTHQLPDGSWFQASRSPKFQPYFESGFPHGQDQWISAAATAWAILGLVEAAAN
ncbi:MAG: ankyrin repeat domain-containing protein [Acidobacteriota bacterium]